MNTTKKRLAIIGTVGVPARYGGFETLAHQLVDHLSDTYDMTVYCSEKAYAKHERIPQWKGAKLVYLPFSANGLASPIYDAISIVHALFFSQILLVLGVSAGIFFPLFKLFSSKTILVNIDGLEWRRNKWSPFAKRFLRFSERIAVKYADGVVADNQAIATYVSDTYGVDAFMIPYGGDHVAAVEATASDRQTYPFLADSYAFKVCRIEPENNIHLVLEAFTEFDRYPLVMVGNWQASPYGKYLWESYHLHPNLILFDPIYDERGLNLLRSNACLYVHGHSAGGTNPSLVEAMSLGLPVMAYDVIYNRYTTSYEAYMFENTRDLIEKLKVLSFGDLVINGMEMKALADIHYRWADIAAYYHQSLELATHSTKSSKTLSSPAMSLTHI